MFIARGVKAIVCRAELLDCVVRSAGLCAVFCWLSGLAEIVCTALLYSVSVILISGRARTKLLRLDADIGFDSYWCYPPQFNFWGSMGYRKPYTVGAIRGRGRIPYRKPGPCFVLPCCSTEGVERSAPQRVRTIHYTAPSFAT